MCVLVKVQEVWMNAWVDIHNMGQSSNEEVVMVKLIKWMSPSKDFSKLIKQLFKKILYISTL